jgi:hypothetical protein
MARRERPWLGQCHVAIRVEQADGVVDVVEIDDQLVQRALVMLDLAGDLAARRWKRARRLPAISGPCAQTRRS